MQNPSPNPMVLAFPPLETYTPMARGPRNLNFEPGDKSSGGGPPHSLDSPETGGGRWGLKLERVQGYLDKVTLGEWKKTVEETGSSAKWGQSQDGAGAESFWGSSALRR